MPAFVLIVHDRERPSGLLTAALHAAGFTVATTSTARALDEFTQRGARCIVLDVGAVPTSGCWDFVAALRERDRHVPVVLLMSFDAAGPRARQAAVDVFLAQPVNVDELVFHVRHRIAMLDEVQSLQRASESAIQEVVLRYSQAIPHELAQPLSIIAGYSELLQDPRTTVQEAREMTTSIMQASEELARRIRRFGALRDYRPSEFGGFPLIDIGTGVSGAPEHGQPTEPQR